LASPWFEKGVAGQLHRRRREKIGRSMGNRSARILNENQSH
jgi:hypothetical protein